MTHQFLTKKSAVEHYLLMGFFSEVKIKTLGYEKMSFLENLINKSRANILSISKFYFGHPLILNFGLIC